MGLFMVIFYGQSLVSPRNVILEEVAAESAAGRSLEPFLLDPDSGTFYFLSCSPNRLVSRSNKRKIKNEGLRR